MIPLTFRPIDQWPDGWRDKKERKPNPFKAGHTDTLDRLQVELDHLAAAAVQLQVDAEPGQVRLDGQLRAGARVNHPGVILTITTQRLGTLVYPCDTFAGRWSGDPPDWQINLRAIALGLEALRKVDRYGIASAGQQYAGWAALPPAGGSDDDIARTARLLLGGQGPGAPRADGIVDRATLDAAYRAAVKNSHPDVGGNPEVFRAVKAAYDLLAQRWPR